MNNTTQKRKLQKNRRRSRIHQGVHDAHSDPKQDEVSKITCREESKIYNYQSSISVSKTTENLQGKPPKESRDLSLDSIPSRKRERSEESRKRKTRQRGKTRKEK